MNNPPDVSPDSKEYEEYAHGVQKHVRAYLMVGAILISFTALTVALSYVNFGTAKANIAVATIASFLCAIALVIYGVWFYRKMKRLGIIA